MSGNDFGWALDRLNNGDLICRKGWNGKNLWIAKQIPNENSKMTEPYTYMKNAQGGYIPWLCSQGDLYATDWMLA